MKRRETNQRKKFKGAKLGTEATNKYNHAANGCRNDNRVGELKYD